MTDSNVTCMTKKLLFLSAWEITPCVTHFLQDCIIWIIKPLNSHKALGQQRHANGVWPHKRKMRNQGVSKPAGYVAVINNARAKPRPCSVNYLSCFFFVFFFHTCKANATANQSVQEREQGMPLCMKWGQSDIIQMAQWHTSCRKISRGVPSLTVGWGTHPVTQRRRSHRFCMADSITCTTLATPAKQLVVRPIIHLN